MIHNNSTNDPHRKRGKEERGFIRELIIKLYSFGQGEGLMGGEKNGKLGKEEGVLGPKNVNGGGNLNSG